MTKATLNMEDSNHQNAFRMRFVNMYVEPTPDGPRPSTRFQRPGLAASITLGAGPIRCSFLWNSHRVVVSGTVVYFDSVAIGVIPGSDNCRFAISDTEIVILSANIPYYVTSVAVAAFTDPDLFPSICDVALLGGRFIFLNATNSQFQWSAVGDARNISGLSFATANENNAQVLRAAFVLNSDVAMFLDGAVEWWTTQSDTTNPFIRSPGRKYNRGIAARNTTALVDNTCFYLGSDKIVYRTGAVPTKVSSFSIEDAIGRLDATQLANCSAFGVTFGGHAFYVLNLPTYGTWAYDAATQKWMEWHSWNRTNFRVSVADPYLMGDSLSGALFVFDKNSNLDVADPIERVVSCYIPIEGQNMRLTNVYLEATHGVGLVTGYGSDPVVEMRWSDSEGYRWSPWFPATLGLQGDRSRKAASIWSQLGMMKPPGRLIEFRCTDPVFFSPHEVRYNEGRTG